ncbi:zinc finger protein 99-like [Crassostrea angulata]|uniref:zinc finger protein 99-like n=1 Tax=Magallana angulata TaxID=2784310 RepID=UPI0022B0E0C9|nr:zinc finger protein 99-like [Crassostrea angulata]
MDIPCQCSGCHIITGRQKHWCYADMRTIWYAYHKMATTSAENSETIMDESHMVARYVKCAERCIVQSRACKNTNTGAHKGIQNSSVVNEKPYACDKCTKAYVHKKDLRNHKLAQHDEGEKFKCDYCNCKG